MHTPPILLPDVTTFGELLAYHGEWEHIDRGFPVPERPAARTIDTAGTDLGNIMDALSPRPRDHGAVNTVGPFCEIDMRQLSGPAHRSIAVVATDATMDALRPRIVTDDDRLSFQIIGHAHSGLALVIAQHSCISGSHWLAYIDPATLPEYPYAARDAAVESIAAEIRAAGRTPYRRTLPDGAREYGYSVPCHPYMSSVPVMVARIDATGNVDRLAPCPAS